jgi:histidyl-tRNA synthetase
LSGNIVQRLPGMTDTADSEYGALQAAGAAFEAFASGLGYGMLDTPLLEQTELFVRKSGGELTTQLYSFVDPGGNRVSLRPEFTSSVIRHYAEQAHPFAQPVRWQYRGPVFRHDGAFRQFTQAGAELIGSAGVSSDLEIVSLASRGLAAMGVDAHTLRIGHLGVLNDLLDSFELSESAKLFVVSRVHELKTGRTDAAGLGAEARSLGLVRNGFDSDVTNVLVSLGADAARELIDGMMSGPTANSMGRRTTDEVVGRLLRKVRTADRADRLEEALRMAGEVARIEGEPSDALERARSIGVPSERLDELAELTCRLARDLAGGRRVVVDLGVARGLAYYTGFIFDVEVAGRGGVLSLGGGGRYDGLVRALGGDDAPALGFAYTLESVAAAMEG